MREISSEESEMTMVEKLREKGKFSGFLKE